MIPEFYSRDEHNIPRAWVARVRESMASLTPNYSANRSVREYLERAYIPAAASYRRRMQNGGALGTEISDWRRALERGWTGLRFGGVKFDTRGEWHHFTSEVALGALDPLAVRVQMRADAQGDQPAFCQEMTRLEGPSDGSGMNLYCARRARNSPRRRLYRAHRTEPSGRQRALGGPVYSLAALEIPQCRVPIRRRLAAGTHHTSMGALRPRSCSGGRCTRVIGSTAPMVRQEQP